VASIRHGLQLWHILKHSGLAGFLIILFSHFIADDLDIAPDFFEYFSATHSILISDPTLWCVSAWNDNGKDSLVAYEPGI